MKKKKVPDYADAEECIAYRKRSKRGEHLTPDESQFCQRMFRLFPEWYARTESRVFNETVPFGSNVYQK